MSNYLHNVIDESGPTQELKDIMDIHGLVPATGHFSNWMRRGYNISSFILLSDGKSVSQEKDISPVCVSEFPGNCSALILTTIQGYFHTEPDFAKRVIDFSIDLTDSFEYASLWITTTSTEFKEYLEKINFQVVSVVSNPHSGNTNYFMCRMFNQPEEWSDG